jgi:hypothetical protein
MSFSTELKNASAEQAAAIVERRRSARMDEIDRLSPALRECVHDYGWHVVNTFLQMGIRKPSKLRHLVETVLDEFSPTRGTHSRQGSRGAFTHDH